MISEKRQHSSGFSADGCSPGAREGCGLLILSDHPRPCVDRESRAHAEIRHNAQRARFGYFWHIADPRDSQLGDAGGPLSVQSQVTRFML